MTPFDGPHAELAWMFLQSLSEDGDLDEGFALLSDFYHMQIEEKEGARPGGQLPSYEFEPSTDVVLDALLPQYVASRIYYAMLEAAASELAARRRAMKVRR